MADQKPKRPADMNKLAKSIVDIATGSSDEVSEPIDEKLSKKRSKAGKKGAKARLKSLTERERMEIAHLAASARWKKTGD